MPNQQIPDRVPINDTLTGAIGQVGTQFIISPTELPSVQTIATGSFMIRYGIPYLGKPQYAIVPDLVVLDYGDMIVGEDAWEFLIKQSNLYPRSDVLGFRNDGQDEMLVVKQLDFALPFHVLAYNNETDRKPIATLSAYIGQSHESSPERIWNHLPQFDSLDDWLTTHDES